MGTSAPICVSYTCIMCSLHRSGPSILNLMSCKVITGYSQSPAMDSLDDSSDEQEEVGKCSFSLNPHS